MKALIRTGFVIIMVLIFSCEKGDWFQSPCKNCETEEPSEAIIEVKLEPIKSFYYSITVSIYEGRLEDNVLLNTYTPGSTTWQISLPVNKMYTFVASYYSNGVYYKAVGSVTPGVKFEKLRCVNPCYSISDNYLDLRIKYS